MQYKIIMLVMVILSNCTVFCMDRGYEEDSQDPVNAANVQWVFNFEDFTRDPFNEGHFEAVTEVDDLVQCFKYFNKCYNEEFSQYINIAKINYSLQRDVKLLQAQKRNNECLLYIKNNPKNNICVPIDIDVENSEIQRGFQQVIRELENSYDTELADMNITLGDACFRINNSDDKEEIKKVIFRCFKDAHEAYITDMQETSLGITDLEGTLRLLIKENATRTLYGLYGLCKSLQNNMEEYQATIKQRIIGEDALMKEILYYVQ